MLQFFKSVRRQKLQKRQLPKYLLYAVGEILLVVVGILIALQINTWSENRQHRLESDRILKNLIQDLIQDGNQLTSNIQKAHYRQRNIDSIYMALDQPDEWQGTRFLQLQMAIVFENRFDVNSGTFDEGLSSGTLKYIEGDSLRQAIFNYYRISKHHYNDEITIKQIYEQIFPVWYQNVSTSQEFLQMLGKRNSQILPLDIEALAQNKNYVAMLNTKYISQTYQIDIWKKRLKEANTLKQKLEKALE